MQIESETTTSTAISTISKQSPMPQTPLFQNSPQASWGSTTDKNAVRRNLLNPITDVKHVKKYQILINSYLFS